MAVPYTFAQTPNGSTIPLAQLDANFTYVENQLSSAMLVTSFSGGSTGLLPAAATTGAITLTGVLSVANGGTGSTSSAGALTNLLPMQTGQSGKFLTTDGNGNLSWAVPGSGSVTGVFSGGTGLSAAPSAGQLLIGNGTGYTLATLTGGTGITIANTPGGITINATGSVTNGTVTSVGLSGGTTGLTVSGLPNPITTSGTFTLGGILSVANGGTGQTTTAGALTSLLPAQSALTIGQVLTSNGTTAYWAPTGGSGTVNTGTVGQLAVYAASGNTVSGLPLGAAGQALTSTGTATTWTSVPTLAGPNIWSGIQNFSTATVTLPSDYPTKTGNNLFTGINAFQNPTNGLEIRGPLMLLAFGPGNGSVYCDGSFTQVASAFNNFTRTTGPANSGTTSTGPYNNVSDARIKQNVADLTGALSLVKQLRGVYFDYIANPGLGRQVGLIAQEVLPIIPEVVTQTTLDLPGDGKDEPENYYAIAYASLVPVLINAIKELEDRVAALEAKG